MVFEKKAFLRVTAEDVDDAEQKFEKFAGLTDTSPDVQVSLEDSPPAEPED